MLGKNIKMINYFIETNYKVVSTNNCSFNMTKRMEILIMTTTLFREYIKINLFNLKLLQLPHL